ncbi:MAG: KH domain-containing protein [Candidatus Aminicenantes bacterium]|nr:MAG: KH domain-containing protein [Candidatus Aminicenantes bacterium]
MHEVRKLGVTRGDPYQELEDMLATMAKMIADNPDEVVVMPAVNRQGGFVAFEVICHEDDAGTLIGSKGKHADAMRTLLMAAGAVRKIRINVQIMSRDYDRIPPR